MPTLFHVFVGIWYYTLMSEMSELQSVPLHIFCILARAFYGMLQSFPFDKIIEVSISRMVLWVAVLILVLDILQVISILSQFNSYTLTDSLSILFSFIFVASDLLFLLQSYRRSTLVKIEIQQPSLSKKRSMEREEQAIASDEKTDDDIILQEVIQGGNESFRLRKKNNVIQF